MYLTTIRVRRARLAETAERAKSPAQKEAMRSRDVIAVTLHGQVIALATLEDDGPAVHWTHDVAAPHVKEIEKLISTATSVMVLGQDLSS